MSKVRGIILADGPDSSGKSTLARELIKQAGGGVILHQSKRFLDRMWVYHTAVLRKAIELSQTQLVVIDRLWMSETIYSKVYRGGTRWPHEGRFMDRVLLKHAAIQVICSDEPKVVEERHQKTRKVRHEDFDSRMGEVAGHFNQLVQPIKLINGAPNDYAEHLSNHDFYCRADVLQYSSCDWQNIAKISEYLLYGLQNWRDVQYQPALLSSDQNILGHLCLATHLIIGDAPKPKLHNVLWPFYEYGNSSLYLAECLHAIGFDETKAMWVNINYSPYQHAARQTASNLADHSHIRRLLKIKPGLKLVVLGDKAERGLTDLMEGNYLGMPGSLSWHKLPHPQWARRFANTPKGKAKYQSQLQKALS